MTNVFFPTNSLDKASKLLFIFVRVRKGYAPFQLEAIGYSWQCTRQWRIQDGAFGANSPPPPPPPPFKKLHTRSRYSNRAVSYSNQAVTMFMRLSLYYRGTTIWNSLPTSITEMNSLNSFKLAYLSHI